MTEAAYYLIKYLESLIMPVILYSFLGSMFLVRPGRRWIKLGKLLLCMLSVLYINSFNDPALNLCGVTLVLTLGAAWMFRLSFWQAPLYVSFFVILMVNVEMVTAYLRTALGMGPDQAFPGVVFLRIMELLLKLFLIQLVKKQVRGVDAEREHGYMGFLSLFSAAVFILLMSGVYPEAEAGRQNIFMIFSGIFLF